MTISKWVIDQDACRLAEKKFSDEQHELLAKIAEELEQEIEGASLCVCLQS